MSSTSTGASPAPLAKPTLIQGLWQRRIPHYPETGARYRYLTLVVVTSIALYYMLFVTGAVGNELIDDFDMTFAQFIWIIIITSALGAAASVGAGLLDRWGRANIVAYGVVICSLLTLFALPETTSKESYLLVASLIGIVEGAVLVATPALIRDFSPQLGRASAMGFWTLGPVLGALIATEVATLTLDDHPGWQYQYRLCGVICVVIAVFALFGLRELAPNLRDQIMVSLRDRALIEARARGLNTAELERNQWRQMMRLDVVGSALAISLFLAFFYTIVSFLPVYMSTNFGFSSSDANALGNWYWVASALTLVITGIVSDKVGVRKPFMIVGALISIGALFVFLGYTDRPDTGYYTFVVVMCVGAVGSGIAYATWMASFTETVEKHNPAATAVGLAVWGGLLRSVVTLVMLGLLFVVNAAGVLVNHGPRLQEIQAAHGPALAAIQTVGTETLGKLEANPNDQAAQLAALTALTGATPADIRTTMGLATQYPAELETLTAIDTATQAKLAANPADMAAVGAAIQQVSAKFGIPADQAVARLTATQRVPRDQLTVAAVVGPKLTQAQQQLRSIAAIPEEDTDYLAEHAAEVQQAVQDSPKQWERWWWICLIAQVVFLPFVLVMAGHWSPRAAAAAAAEHDRQVQEELAALENGPELPAEPTSAEPVPTTAENATVAD